MSVMTMGTSKWMTLSPQQKRTPQMTLETNMPAKSRA